MKTIRILMTTLMLIILSASAHSTPFSIDDVSGNRGDPVALTLNDGGAQNLESVTLLVTYDSSQLEFDGVLVGTLTSDFSPIFNVLKLGEVLVSLAFGQPPIDGQRGSILTAQFHIRSTASLDKPPPTVTMIRPDFYVDDYEVPLITGHVIILAGSTSVPEASTPMLMLLGLILFGALRRQVG